MGTGQSSKIVGYNELRYSIPGSLVPENDLEWFYANCVVDTMQTEPIDETLSDVLYPRPSQLFYVVISGEVLLQLKRLNSKVTTIVTYAAGEVIHCFNADQPSVFPAQQNLFGDFFTHGDFKLAYHFNRLHKSVGCVLGMDASGFAKFRASATGNIHPLTSFLQMSVWDVMRNSSFWKSITFEQTRPLTMLLKVQLHHPGSVLRLRGHHPKAMYGDGAIVGTGDEATGSATTSTSALVGGSVALLLHGTVLSVPSSANHDTLVGKLSAGKVTQHAQPAASAGFRIRSPRATPVPHIAPAVFAVATTSSQVQSSTAPLTTHSVEYNYATSYYEGYHGHVIMRQGAVLGNDVYCVQSSDISAREYVTSSACVVGYISTECMNTLCATDSRLQRVFTRNYYYFLLIWIRPSVPLLRDMDIPCIALLSCKLSLLSHTTDANIQVQGQHSDSAGIVLAGTCKELVPTVNTTSTDPILGNNDTVDEEEESGDAENSTSDAPPLPTPSTAVVNRVVSWGGLFGEVALATHAPYMHTVVSREPCLVLHLPHNILSQIFHTHQQTLNTLRIRLLGPHVDIMHVLSNPQGFLGFHQYLKQSRCVRYIEFYSKIVRYDKLCGVVCKMYKEVCRLRCKVVQDAHINSDIGASMYDPNATVHSDMLDASPHVYTTPVKSKNNSSDDSDHNTAHIETNARVSSGRVISALNSSDSEVAHINAGADTQSSIQSATDVIPHSTSGLRQDDVVEDEHKHYTILVKPVPLTTAGSAKSASAKSVGKSSVVPVGGVDAGESTVVSGAEDSSTIPAPGVHFSSSDTEHAQNLDTTTGISPHDEEDGRYDFEESPQLSPAPSPTQLSEHMYNSNADFLHTPHTNTTTTAKSSTKDTAYQAELQLRIKRHTQKIIKHIIELHEYARSITETYIFEGSIQQLKLTVVLRVRTERDYSVWGKNVRNIQGKGDVVSSVTSNIGRFRVLPVSEIEQFVSINSTSGSMRVDTTIGANTNTVYCTTSNSPTYHTPHSPHSPHSRSGSPQFPLNSGTRELSFAVRRVNSYSEKVNSISSKNLTTIIPTIPTTTNNTINSITANTTNTVNTVTSTRSAKVANIDIRTTDIFDTLDHHYLFEIIDMSFVHLFEDCKTEVLRFMREEKFSGWKSTPEFQLFLSGMKVYERQGEKNANATEQKK